MVVAVSVFCKKSTKSQGTSSESSQRNASSSTQQQTLELTVNKSQVSIAEIKGGHCKVGKCKVIIANCKKGHSKNSNNSITELFKVMFPDSQIAKNVYTWYR